MWRGNLLMILATFAAFPTLAASAGPTTLAEIAAFPSATGPDLSGRPDFDASIVGIAKRTLDEVTINAEIALRNSGSDIFKRTVRGVVKVLTNEGEGSGTILGSNGLVLTNWHVTDGYKTVGVQLFPAIGSTGQGATYIADVLRFDEVADLSLLRIRNPPENLVVIRGASELPAIGGDVHAIGHPKGQDWSYTRGYVSQIRRDYEWKYAGGTAHKAEVIQTQTPINPGNSGGPLFNDAAELVGINSFGNSTAQGLNYAVSINEVRGFLARSENRVAKREAAKGAGPRVLRSADTNGDGRIDAQVLDFDGDGKPDGMQVDIDGDGKTDILYLDMNGNGKFDVWVAESTHKGRSVLKHYYDFDEDGEADAIGIDYDRDGEPDEVIKAR